MAQPTLPERTPPLADGEPLVFEETREVIDTIELSERQAEAITRLLEHGLPVVHSGHWLRSGWEGLAHAELAVVNARAEYGDAAARATLRSLEALTTDERWR